MPWWKSVPKKYGAMLKKLKSAKKDIKRTKVKKDCKTQENPGFKPWKPCVVDSYADHYTTETDREELQISIVFLK